MREIKIANLTIHHPFFILLLVSGIITSSSTLHAANLYRNKTFAFSIIFPQGWIQRDGQTPSTIVVSEDTKGGAMIIQVKPLPIPLEMTFDQFPESKLKMIIPEVFQDLKKQVYHDAALEETGTTYVCNKKAIWMVINYSMKHAFTELKIRSIVYMIWFKGRQYTISCGSSVTNYKDYHNIFLTSIRTFLFEDVSWYGR